MGNMILHATRRAFQATADDIINVETPPSEGARWVPIAHSQVRSHVMDACIRLGWTIAGEQYALTKDALRCFGILSLATRTGDLPPIPGIPATYEVCFSNAHDKSMAVRVGFGLSVSICDNLSMWSSRTVRVRHSMTPIARLGASIFAELEQQLRPSCLLDSSAAISRMQLRNLALHEAKAACFDLAEQGCVTFRDLPQLWREYRRSDGPGGLFPKTAHDTAFNLLMAATEVQKTSIANAHTLMRRSEQTTKVLAAL